MKNYCSRALYIALARWHFFFLSRGEVTEREPSVISSFPLHPSSLRMQAAASPSFKLAVLLLTVVLIHFLSFFSDLKKKKILHGYILNETVRIPCRMS